MIQTFSSIGFYQFADPMTHKTTSASSTTAFHGTFYHSTSASDLADKATSLLSLETHRHDNNIYCC